MVISKTIGIQPIVLMATTPAAEREGDTPPHPLTRFATCDNLLRESERSFYADETSENSCGARKTPLQAA